MAALHTIQPVRPIPAIAAPLFQRRHMSLHQAVGARPSRSRLTTVTVIWDPKASAEHHQHEDKVWVAPVHRRAQRSLFEEAKAMLLREAVGTGLHRRQALLQCPTLRQQDLVALRSLFRNPAWGGNPQFVTTNRRLRSRGQWVLKHHGLKNPR